MCCATFESAWTRTIARSRDFDKKVKPLSTWRNFSKLEKEEVLDTLLTHYRPVSVINFR